MEIRIGFYGCEPHSPDVMIKFNGREQLTGAAFENDSIHTYGCGGYGCGRPVVPID